MANMPCQTDSLNLVFNKILSDLKNSSPIWEDFLSKSNKLHTAIRNVLQCSTIFWEAFQKIADLAVDAQGATKEIGVSLTRLCMRQRLIESKIKSLNHHLITSLTNPIQDKIEEWKRFASQLDKDRFKETKKAKGEWKKAIGESMRLQKKAQKRGSMRGLGSLQNEVEGALKNAADKFSGLQYVESICLRRAMTHERERFCFLYTCIKPVLECQISLLSDITSLDELMKALTIHTCSPNCLPEESEEVIRHIIDPDYAIANKSNCNLSGNTVFSSGFGSRKSSVASLNSHQSLSSGSGPSTTTKAIFGHRNSELKLRSYGSVRYENFRDALRSDCYGSFRSVTENRSFSQLDDYYKDAFSKKGEGVNLRASHLSMASSVQEPSGISGDYRVSDDDSKNVEESVAEDDSDDEDNYDEEDDESEEEVKTPSSPSASLWSEKLAPGADSGAKFMASRHTISGASAFSRPSLSAAVFEPLNAVGHTSDASLPKMDQSKQLYPNQAIPLPVYTNLQELTNAAQRKFSMSKPPIEKEFDMLTSMNINTNFEEEPQSNYQQVLPSSSKAAGFRRMTLPEVPLQEKQQCNEVLYGESNYQNSFSSDDDLTPPSSPMALEMQKSRRKIKLLHACSPPHENEKIPEWFQLSFSDRMKEPNQQSSTLTRTSEHHYNCPQVPAGHHRSSSVSDNGRTEQNSAPTSKIAAPIAAEIYESTSSSSTTKDLLMSELNQHLKRNKSAPTYQLITEQCIIWSDIDPDLPMPPPPSTADEEIRLASIPISPHPEVILRHNSAPSHK